MPTAGKGAIVNDCTEGKRSRHNSRAHASHIEDTPKIPRSSEYRILHDRVLQNLFFKRLLLYVGVIAVLPNTEKLTEKKEEMGKLSHFFLKKTKLQKRLRKWR